MSKKELTVGAIRNALEQEIKAQQGYAVTRLKLSERFAATARAEYLRDLVENIFSG